MAQNFRDPEFFLSLVRSVNYPYFIGSIFPSEMAFFLWSCEQAGIRSIIESGRQDGYSTAVLGRWADDSDMAVVSVDVEIEPERAKATRDRLSRFKQIDVLKGNSYQLMPQLLSKLEAPIALLIDGPKEHSAIYLSAAACTSGKVRMVAHHNTKPSMPWYAHFVNRFGQPKFLESTPIVRCDTFENFRSWEMKIANSEHRDLGHSSLAISTLDWDASNQATQNTSVWHAVNVKCLTTSWKAGFYFAPFILIDWLRYRLSGLRHPNVVNTPE